MAFMNQDSTK